MEILIVLLIVAVIAYAGYAYTQRNKIDVHNFVDEDFTDCQSTAGLKYGKGSSEYNSEVVSCYVDKKTDKVKKLLDRID